MKRFLWMCAGNSQVFALSKSNRKKLSTSNDRLHFDKQSKEERRDKTSGQPLQYHAVNECAIPACWCCQTDPMLQHTETPSGSASQPDTGDEISLLAAVLSSPPKVCSGFHGIEAAELPKLSKLVTCTGWQEKASSEKKKCWNTFLVCHSDNIGILLSTHLGPVSHCWEASCSSNVRGMTFLCGAIWNRSSIFRLFTDCSPKGPANWQSAQVQSFYIFRQKVMHLSKLHAQAPPPPPPPPGRWWGFDQGGGGQIYPKTPPQGQRKWSNSPTRGRERPGYVVRLGPLPNQLGEHTQISITVQTDDGQCGPTPGTHLMVKLTNSPPPGEAKWPSGQIRHGLRGSHSAKWVMTNLF